MEISAAAGHPDLDAGALCVASRTHQPNAWMAAKLVSGTGDAWIVRNVPHGYMQLSWHIPGERKDVLPAL